MEKMYPFKNIISKPLWNHVHTQKTQINVQFIKPAKMFFDGYVGVENDHIRKRDMEKVYRSQYSVSLNIDLCATEQYNNYPH